jgi:hypothetical protein
MNRATLPAPSQLLGNGFYDETTDLTFEFHHPRARPDVWAEYLDGATAAYAKYGVGEAIDRNALAHSTTVSVFFVGRRADGTVAAGVRFHGPLNSIEESSSLVEMAPSSEIGRLREQVAGFIAHGLLEIKGAWSLAKGSGPHSMFRSFNRCLVHILHWLRCEHAIATLAEQHIEPLIEGGAYLLGAESVPFPSEEYRTVLMAWRRSRLLANTVPPQVVLERRELSKLAHNPRSESRSRATVLEDQWWRPLVLDCRSRADRALAECLISTGTRVVDRIESQRAELDELRPPVDPDLRVEPPRYVYYPWRRTMLKTVGPRSFERLRLDRNRHKITAAEQAQLRQVRIGVVGLSVGHAVAHLLALEGLCGELRLADMDRLATTNLNRIPATLLDLGLNKAVAAARRIAEVDPYLPVSIFPEGLNEDNLSAFLDQLDLVIEECDSLDVKLLVREAARDRSIPVLMETSDRGLLDVERFDREPGREPFHGLLAGVRASDIAGLSMRDKVPYVLRILEPEQVSTRGAASLAEVGTTLSTWPQLAGDVTLGAATVAAAVLRLVRDGDLRSGRLRVDTDALLDTIAEPAGTGIVASAAPELPPEERPADPLRLLAFAASRAPSGGNVQPWRFQLTEQSFSVYLDPTKSVTMDVGYRASYLAIGASLFNATVAAAATGRLGPVELFPNARMDGPVGLLHLDRGTDAELARLLEPVLARSTNRRKGTPAPIPASVLERLREAASHGGGVQLLTERAGLDTAGELLAESDRLRFLIPQLHREMVSELRWPGVDPLETGIDVRTLELDGADLAALSLSRRDDVMRQLAEWDAGQALGDNTRKAIRSCSALAVVTAAGSRPSDFVRCGEAVMRVWLAAEEAGLAVQPISPLFLYAHHEQHFDALAGERLGRRLAALAEQFRALCALGPGEQLGLVLRLSHAPPPTVRSRRLPLEAVLTETTATAGTHGDDRS